MEPSFTHSLLLLESVVKVLRPLKEKKGNSSGRRFFYILLMDHSSNMSDSKFLFSFLLSTTPYQCFQVKPLTGMASPHV